MVKPLAAAAAALFASALWTHDAIADEAPPAPADLAAPPTRWGNLEYELNGRLAGVTVAGSTGTSGTPNAQNGEMVVRYVW